MTGSTDHREDLAKEVVDGGFENTLRARGGLAMAGAASSPIAAWIIADDVAAKTAVAAPFEVKPKTLFEVCVPDKLFVAGQQVATTPSSGSAQEETAVAAKPREKKTISPTLQS